MVTPVPSPLGLPAVKEGVSVAGLWVQASVDPFIFITDSVSWGFSGWKLNLDEGWDRGLAAQGGQIPRKKLQPLTLPSSVHAKFLAV